MTGHGSYKHNGKLCFNGVQPLHPDFNTPDSWVPEGLVVGDETPADWCTMDTSSADFIGCKDSRFIVLNRSEVEELIGMLQDALSDAYGPNPEDYPKETD